MERTRVALIVTHELPVQRDRVLHDLRIIVAYFAVEGNGAAHAMPREHVHDAKDANAVAIVARGPVDDVGRLARAARHGLMQRKRLDVGNDPESDASTVWPS